jgi:hypothetical protein
MLEISRKYTYLPEVVVSSAGSSTTRAARHKMEKNRSRIYDFGVVPTRGNNMYSFGEYVACLLYKAQAEFRLCKL